MRTTPFESRRGGPRLDPDLERRFRALEDWLRESADTGAFTSTDEEQAIGGGVAAITSGGGGGGGGGGGSPPTTLAGDVIGLVGSTTVVAIRGVSVDTPTAADDQKYAQYDFASGTIRWVSLVTDQNTVTWDGVTYPIKRARISATASGSTAVVPLVALKRITVLAWNYVAAAAVEVTWLSNATIILGPQSYSATGGNEASRIPNGYLMRTASGEALNISLSGAVSVEGALSYIEENP